MGRFFAGAATLRHRIKPADRLLGNRHLQHEARPIHAALCRVMLACIRELPEKGRRGNTVGGKRARSNKSRQSAHAAREP